MNKRFIWVLLLVVTTGLSLFYLTRPVQLAGDIAEYYGITESVIRHQSVSLSKTDQTNLEQVLYKAYFLDPGYYIKGSGDMRFPVHFFFYSLLVVPVRLILALFSLNQLAAMSVANVFIVSIGLALLMKYFVKKTQTRFLLLLFVFLSPLAFFLPWPGPDAFYVIVLLLGVFLFYNKYYLWATFAAIIASWQSQPLTVVALGFLSVYLLSEAKAQVAGKEKYILIRPKTLFYIAGFFILWAIPYLYNYVAFGVATPWLLLQDGWTRTNGFGIHNASIQKLFEQFFDPNIGLFWYAPLLFLAGSYFLIKGAMHRKRDQFILVVFLLTAFAYQTNPAWHYGTAGYGPTRHVLFALPFLLYAVISGLKQYKKHAFFVGMFVLSQVLILSLNGYYLPNFQNTLYQSPFAQLLLRYAPRLYNPTPEIFVDRTNHTDLGFISSAVYKENGACIKAYVLITQIDQIKTECGDNSAFSSSFFDNQFLRKTNFDRQSVTTEATFWPDSASCEDWYITDNSHPFKCMKTVQDVATLTGITDLSRIKTVQNFKGVWRFETGLPTKITIPAGYIAQLYSFEGMYVNYK